MDEEKVPEVIRVKKSLEEKIEKAFKEEGFEQVIVKVEVYAVNESTAKRATAEVQAKTSYE